MLLRRLNVASCVRPLQKERILLFYFKFPSNFRVSFVVRIYRKFGSKLADWKLNEGHYDGQLFKTSHFRFKRQQTVSANVLISYALALISRYGPEDDDDDNDSGNDEDCVDLWW